MNKKIKNDWLMYHEIHKQRRLGFSIERISRYLVLNPRTVNRLLKMTESEYEEYLSKKSERSKILDDYESFIKGRLTEAQDASTAQVHDWLKERYENFPEVSSRTVYNFVMYVRHKHNLPTITLEREFMAVEDLPYGQQAQVDFGEYNMRKADGKRKKVRFFCMSLSRSRMKYVLFNDSPFISHIVLDAHEKAFDFYGGIPHEIVYDQDRIFIVDENLGAYILTAGFGQYTKKRNFNIHFCRKADPQSKGKIENVVKYVKQNFLYHRIYESQETLNKQVLGWLNRTANYLPHNTTKKPPKDLFEIERQHLNIYVPLHLKPKKEMNKYSVRKHNVINYNGNFYSVPIGTYKGEETEVIVEKDNDSIHIFDLNNKKLGSHKISPEKGKTLVNSNHRRDTSQSLKALRDQVVEFFTDKEEINDMLEKIKKRFPRNYRDHLEAMLKPLSVENMEVAGKALKFCQKNQISHAHEFTQVFYVILDESKSPGKLEPEIKPLYTENAELVDHIPEKSDINDYEDIIDSQSKNAI